MHHSGGYVENNSQDLEPALKQMKSFALSHPYEIFVVQIIPGYNSNLKPGHFNVSRMILSILGDRLVPYYLSNSHSLENIKAMNKNIVLLSGFGSFGEGYLSFWNYNDENIRKSTWDDYQSNGEHTPSEVIAWLKPHIEDKLRNPPKRFHVATCLMATINLWNAAVAWVNPNIASWLIEWANNPDLLKGMNIFEVDFFDGGDSQVVNRIIALNNDSALKGMRATSMASGTRRESGSLLKEANEDDSKFFSEAVARKTLSDRGLDWHKFQQEYQKTGLLGEESMNELASKGIPRSITSEFLKQYAGRAKQK